MNKVFPDQMNYGENVKYVSGQYVIPQTSNLKSVSVVQIPKFGIPLAKVFNIDTNGELWNAICHTDEFVDAYNYNKVVGEDYKIDRIYADYCGEGYTIVNNDVKLTVSSSNYPIKGTVSIPDDFGSLLCLRAEYRDNSPVVGYLKISASNDKGRSKEFEYPIYADDFEVVKAVGEMVNTVSWIEEKEFAVPFDMDSIDEYYTACAEECIAVALVDVRVGAGKLLTTDEISYLAKYTTSFGFNGFLTRSSVGLISGSFSTVSESRYILLVKTMIGDEMRVFEVRFRKDAISDEDLTRYFVNLDK